MSEQLTAAAAAMGVPEPLVERSAEARAAETGAGAEEILAAWAGDAPAPATPTAPEPDETATTEEPVEEPVKEEPTREPVPEIAIETPPEQTAPPAPATGPYKPPVLVGAEDRPLVMLTAAVGLFIVVFLVGLVGPSISADTVGARTSDIEYSDDALDGQALYASLNCAACHTQMVRPVIADVGLGAVTLNDSNQILGTRRFGPDLSNVGSRVSRPQLGAIIGGQVGHPSYQLSDDDLQSLVSYLAESVTSGQGDGS